jgi:uncharacterized protein
MVLIVASSGRMLAEMANRSGILVVVVDLFADIDTCKFAEAVIQVTELNRKCVCQAIELLSTRYRINQVIYGSGLESFPDTLGYLASRFEVLGNAVEVFEAIHDKPRFFDCLERFGVSFPEVRYVPPAEDSGWLVKPFRGQGGIGIGFWEKVGRDAGERYWQRFIDAKAYSVLFLADGSVYVLVGINRQWVVNTQRCKSFAFSGITHAVPFSTQERALLDEWLTRLVPTLGLKGLNSLDFLKTEQGLTVLEINPRPSASMQLYEGPLLA